MGKIENWYGNAPLWQKIPFGLAVLLVCFIPSCLLFVGVATPMLTPESGWWFIPYLLTTAGTGVSFWAVNKYFLKVY